MEIVKKNIISIICGVVALAAVAVWFTIGTGKQQEVQDKLAQSKQTHDALAALLTKTRQLPTVDPDNPTTDNLKQFPSEKIIADILAYEQKDPHGLNGFLLLLHVGSQRRDKTFLLLDDLLTELKNRGYALRRVDALLELRNE